MRIWFNRGFSLAPIAKAMKAGESTLEIIVSIGADKPIYHGPDETFAEPDLPPHEYIAWAREQIVSRRIDLFIPTRLREHFYDVDLPCAMHFPCAKSALAIIDDKYAFAAATSRLGCHLPTRQAESVQELEQVLADYEAHDPSAQLCVKPRRGVNGHGFWKLSDVSATAHLLHPEYRTIRDDMLVHALRVQESEESFIPVVIMEYLPGPEVSLDVLAHEGKVLKYVARTKLGERQQITGRHELESQVERLSEQFGLNGVVNLQFRKARDGHWKVLEINPRPAGGSTYAEEHGFELLADWARLLARRLAPGEVRQPSLAIEIERRRGHQLVSAEVIR